MVLLIWENSVHTAELLQKHGVRPTKIRRAIAGILYDGQNKHVTVENVIEMARAAKVKTSVASVYNTLNQFANAGLLRRVTIDQGRTFYDTNLEPHHHFYYEDEERLEDIPLSDIKVSGLPAAPKGKSVKSVDVTIRL